MSNLKDLLNTGDDNSALLDSAYVHLTGSETLTGNKTFAGTSTFSGANTFSGTSTFSGLTIAYISINAQTGTAYTTVLTDDSKLLTLDNAAANTCTIPPNSSVAYPIGTTMTFSQIGAGQTTLVAGAGVTLNTEVGLLMTAQYAMASAIKIATDTWLVTGSLSAA